MIRFSEARDWARETFGGIALGDVRRTERLVRIATRALQMPAGQVSAVFEQEHERQAAYDFLESERVSAACILGGIAAVTARGSAGSRYVFVPVDGSSLTLVDRVGDKGFGSIGRRELPTRGLKVISALAVDPRGVPLGVATLEWWARGEKRRTRTRRWRGDETEMRYWRDAVDHIEAAFERDAPDVRRWYVLDREGDESSILTKLSHAGAYFTVRSKHDRLVQRSDGRRAKLSAIARRAKYLGSYCVDVPASPKRRKRRAVLDVRAERVTLLLPNYDHEDYPTALTVTVLLARERNAPRGEKRLAWRLLTHQHITRRDDALRIIRSYSTRWRIEEFHRTWKSGACGVEDTLLRRRAHVIRWATVLAAVAARTERLKYLARNDPDAPATTELSPLEIEALIAAKRRHKNSVEVIPDTTPTIRQAVHWIAQLGSWDRYRKGEPGSIVIARGLARFEAWAAGWIAGRGYGKTRKKRDQR